MMRAARKGRAIVPGLLMMGLVSCAAADGTRGVEYRPADDVPRLTDLPLDTDDVGIVSDFDLSGDTLFLVDRTGRVLMAELRDTTWTVIRTVGRAGAGPGEFLAPTGISVNGTSFVVIDNTRLQFFSRAGELLAFHNLDLPCPMLLAGVAHGREGVFVHGNCMRAGYATDTLKTVLAWSSDTAHWEIVAEDLRMTRDGRTGNIFTASNALTPGRERHLFGSGAANCVWVITHVGHRPEAEQQCGLVTQLYSTDPPPELQARLRAGIGGTRMEWPPTLPVFIERLATPAGMLLVRPYTTDSAVVQEALPSGRDVAVAGVDGIVACKAGGCLWLSQHLNSVRVSVLAPPRASTKWGE